MKIWLDDIRDAPDKTWTVARNVGEVLDYVLDPRIHIEVLSLDHDLGDDQEFDGYWLANWFERHCAVDPENHHYLPDEFRIHSANPVGRKNMQAAIDSIERMRNAS